MIERQRSKPRPLEKLELLVPRVPAHFKCLPDMQQDLAKRASGYIGEKKTDYHLRAIAHKYTILQDVYLKLPYGNSIQIDTLILTPHAIFIIESKNYKRMITFDTILQQLIHDNGDTEKGYRYPITQVESQQLLLENWLHDHQFTNIPIHFFIAIADPSTIIRVEGDKHAIANTVMHAEHIPKKLLEIDSAYAKQQNNSRIPVKRIQDTLSSECQEFDIDILGKYSITPEMILPGVRCPTCEKLRMNRIFGSWYCPKCKTKSHQAHQEALDAYLLLIKPWIKNSECTRFLHVLSRHQTLRILRSSNLKYAAKGKYWMKESVHLAENKR